MSMTNDTNKTFDAGVHMIYVCSNCWQYKCTSEHLMISIIQLLDITSLSPTVRLTSSFTTMLLCIVVDEASSHSRWTSTPMNISWPALHNSFNITLILHDHLPLKRHVQCPLHYLVIHLWNISLIRLMVSRRWWRTHYCQSVVQDKRRTCVLWSSSGMNTFVGNKISLLTKHFVTNVTAKTFHTIVSFFVHLQIIVMSKSNVTNVIFKLFDATVDNFVLL